MAHDPVEQGQDKYNSFLGSMFILITDVSSREMLMKCPAASGKIHGFFCMSRIC